MKKYCFLVFVIFMGLSAIFSQEKVEDTAFDVMLRNLLSHTVKEASPEDIIANDQVVLLDAREKVEFSTSHIENALWVGFDDFKLKRVKHINKDQKIIVYCSVGYRSERIAENLEKAGYKDVYNLYGGIFEWVHQGNKVRNKDGETKKVHTFNEEWSQWLLKGIKVY